jgi:gliding motility-associated-like protein
MKKYITILLFLLPYAAQAQLDVPGITSNSAGTVVPTSWFTGREEHVFVFYDSIPLSFRLQATDSLCTAPATCTAPSTFTWTRLNVADTTLDFVYDDHPVSAVSELPAATFTEGGYQVAIQRADTSLIDTLTTWIFVDTFRIDTVEVIFNDCGGLRLEMRTAPHLYDPYTIYNFKEFLGPLHVGESIFRGAQEVFWNASDNIDIHKGVDAADNSWMNRKTNGYVVIDSPPPLYASSYTVEVTDVFGKQGSYTTPYAVDAIAVYPKAEVEKEDDLATGTWTDTGTALSGEPLQLNDEALFRLKFSHGNSINVDRYIWKGFANAATQNGNRTIVWTDTLTDAGTAVYPRMPHKGRIVDGYIPGTYTVRLVVNNAYCVDSAEVNIMVDPSKLDTESIPNAFTPNGDMQNDLFKFVESKEPVSMEYIRVYVYNRSGGLVYRYEGAADAWKGWDGRFMGTGNDVAEGVYFYIINGEGWDGVRHNTSEYKGSVHVFR